MSKMKWRMVALIAAALCASGARAGEVTLQYLGAFRAAEIPYGGSALSYCDEGNSGLGSLYTYRAGMSSGMYEYDLPAPLAWTARDPSILPKANVLQGPVSSVGPHGLEYLPGMGEQTSGKLYFGSSGGSGSSPTHGYMDLDFTNIQGAWELSGVDDRRVGHYVFEVPESWRTNVGGKPLVTGFGWAPYGKGPDLYAYDPFPAQGVLPATKLLEYDSSHTMTGWDTADAWEAGAWVQVESDSAVLIAGKKVIDGVPRAQILFYHPDDFVSVLGGGNVYDPQPYKAISVEDKMFGSGSTITGMAYDRAGNVLYAVDPIDSYWGLAIHAWQVVNDLAVPHPGDANQDDKVDWDDYTILADHCGLVGVAGFADGGWVVGNFNDDDVVDEDDYGVWQANYGYDGESVPEPALLLLLGAGGALLVAAKRRRAGIGGGAPAVAWLVAIALLAAAVSGPARAEDYDWVTPMRHVHADYQDRTVPAIQGTIAQFGDSITVTQAYFEPLRYAHTNVSPQDQVKLDWLQSYIYQPCWGWYGGAYGSTGGTTVSWGLENMDTWLSGLNPEVALIMWGTNDLYQGPAPPRYTEYLSFIVQKCKDNGTVPILFTIPPSHSWDATAHVAAAREVAATERIPLIDYYDEIVTRRPHNPPVDTWDGADPMWDGYSGYEVPTLIACDGIHPSNWSAGQRNFDEEEGLNKNGFTLRNYLTLQKLYEVYEEVLDRPAPPPLPPVGQITYDLQYVGEGKFGFTFTIHGNDFQEKAFGADVTIEITDGGGIDVAASTFLEPFLSHAEVLIAAEDMYHIEAGTGLGSAYEQVDLAYVVTDGDLHGSGTVARDGADYPVDVDVSLPEFGDANLDGCVDGLDYNTWSLHYLEAAGWTEGDYNGDAIADGLDYNVWSLNYQVGCAGAAVPEPATLGLFAAGALLVLRRRRRA